MALRRLLRQQSLWKPLLQPQTVGPPLRSVTLPALQQWITCSRGLLSTFQRWDWTLRTFSSASDPGRDGEEVKARGKETSAKKSLMIDDEEYDSITDKIPEKPMTAAEGVSYMAIILAAFAILAACLWAFISNYVWDPVEYTCFNITLEKLRSDPRVTVRVGDVIKGYGSDSMNRRQRHMIRNRQYTDANGIDHIQIQFNIKGSGGAGVVYADMFKDESKKWQYTYLYVDAPERGKNTLQRLAIVTPPI